MNGFMPMALCGVLVGLVIGLLIGAVILRSACSIHNSLRRSDDPPRSMRDWDDVEGSARYNSISRSGTSEKHVPIPQFGHAMGIVFVGALIGAVVGAAIGFAIGFYGATAGLDQRQVQLVTQAIALPIGFFVHASVLALMLPTSYGKALLVTLLQYAIVLVIVLIIGAVIVAMLFATGGFNRFGR